MNRNGGVPGPVSNGHEVSGTPKDRDNSAELIRTALFITWDNRDVLLYRARSSSPRLGPPLSAENGERYGNGSIARFPKRSKDHSCG